MARFVEFLVLHLVGVPGVSSSTISIGSKCLDLAGGEVLNGAVVELWECDGSTNQQWTFASDSWAMKYAQNEEFCVDAGQLAAGNIVYLWECNGLDQQVWGYDSDAGTVYLANSLDASLCLDVPGGLVNDGAQLNIWDCNGCWNQVWSFADLAALKSRSLGATNSTKIHSSDDCPSQPTADFPRSCDDKSGGDWPEFADQASLSQDSKWSKYFELVYGEVPSFGYPICVSGFRVMYQNALKSAGIDKTIQKKGKQPGDYYQGKEYKGSHLGLIFHGKGTFQGFESNMWVEGVHCGTKLETAGAWYFYAPGSGVWIYSGSTRAYQHREECYKDILGKNTCSDFQCGGKLFTTAKEKFGLDTIQYLAEGGPPKPGHMFIHTTGVGKYTCGAKQTAYSAGWVGQSNCDCDQSQTCQNCQGFAANNCGQEEVV